MWEKGGGEEDGWGKGVVDACSSHHSHCPPGQWSTRPLTSRYFEAYGSQEGQPRLTRSAVCAQHVKLLP